MAFAAMLHEEDPVQKLIKDLGDLSGVELFFNQILIAVYERPEKTKSGLILSAKTRDEDKYQSKIGLVVKMGPAAFVDSGEWKFDVRPTLGEWVLFRPSDGWAMGVNGVLCRVLVDTSVKGRIANPDAIW